MVRACARGVGGDGGGTGVVGRSGGLGLGELHLSTLPAIWSAARDGVNATWLERAMCGDFPLCY